MDVEHATGSCTATGLVNQRLMLVLYCDTDANNYTWALITKLINTV